MPDLALDPRLKAQRTIQLKRTIAAIILACDAVPLDIAQAALQAALADQRERAYDQVLKKAMRPKEL